MFMQENSDHWHAIRKLAEHKHGCKIDEYHSAVDFLFCEIFRAYREPCFDYYKNKPGSCPLRDMPEATKEQIGHWQRKLIFAVTTAYRWHCDDRCKQWWELRKVALAA